MAENTFTWEYQKYNALVVREVPEQLNIENCFYIFIFKNRVFILRPDRINDKQNKYPIKAKLDEPESVRVTYRTKMMGYLQKHSWP